MKLTLQAAHRLIQKNMESRKIKLPSLIRNIPMFLILMITNLYSLEFSGEWYLYEKEDNTEYYYYKSRSKNGDLKIKEIEVIHDEKSYSLHNYKGKWQYDEKYLYEKREFDPTYSYKYRIIDHSDPKNIKLNEIFEFIEEENDYIFTESKQKVKEPRIPSSYKKVPPQALSFDLIPFQIEYDEFIKKAQAKKCPKHNINLTKGPGLMITMEKVQYERIFNFSKSHPYANRIFPLVKGLIIDVKNHNNEYEIPVMYCETCRMGLNAKTQALNMELLKKSVILSHEIIN